MKYPTPTTNLECTVPYCGFFDEIELVDVATIYVDSIWIIPSGWDHGWTVNEDGGAVCPNHEYEPEETLSPCERNPDLVGKPDW